MYLRVPVMGRVLYVQQQYKYLVSYPEYTYTYVPPVYPSRYLVYIGIPWYTLPGTNYFPFCPEM